MKKKKDPFIYVPCSCRSSHGMALTKFEEDGTIGVSLLNEYWSKENSFLNRIRMVWLMLRGIYFSDFILLDRKDREVIAEFLKSEGK